MSDRENAGEQQQAEIVVRGVNDETFSAVEDALAAAGIRPEVVRRGE